MKYTAGYNAKLPKYDTGGTLKSVASGALAGAAAGSTVVPPWGTIIGAVGGATFGLVKGIKQTKLEKKAEAARQSSLAQQYATVGQNNFMQNRNAIQNQTYNDLNSFYMKKGGSLINRGPIKTQGKSISNDAVVITNKKGTLSGTHDTGHNVPIYMNNKKVGIGMPGEVIDYGNNPSGVPYVLSDTLGKNGNVGKNGFTFSKEYLSLEKKKTPLNKRKIDIAQNNVILNNMKVDGTKKYATGGGVMQTGQFVNPMTFPNYGTSNKSNSSNEISDRTKYLLSQMAFNSFPTNSKQPRYIFTPQNQLNYNYSQINNDVANNVPLVNNNSSSNNTPIETITRQSGIPNVNSNKLLSSLQGVGNDSKMNRNQLQAPTITSLQEISRKDMRNILREKGLKGNGFSKFSEWSKNPTNASNLAGGLSVASNLIASNNALTQQRKALKKGLDTQLAYVPQTYQNNFMTGDNSSYNNAIGNINQEYATTDTQLQGVDSNIRGAIKGSLASKKINNLNSIYSQMNTSNINLRNTNAQNIQNIANANTDILNNSNAAKTQAIANYYQELGNSYGAGYSNTTGALQDVGNMRYNQQYINSINARNPAIGNDYMGITTLKCGGGLGRKRKTIKR